MDDEYLREPVYAEILGEIVDGLALAALVTALLHLFWLYVGLHAGLQVYLASHADGCARDGHTKVHEVVKCVGFVAAAVALQAVHQLACEEVRDDGIVSV